MASSASATLSVTATFEDTSVTSSSSSSGYEHDASTSNIYFAVPGSGLSSGYQYLRLEEYNASEEAGQDFQATDLAPASSKGITLHAYGYLLLNADNGVYETFGDALKETVSGAGHTVSIEKGDWTLEAKDGNVSITANSTQTGNGKITLKSTGSSIELYAPGGQAYVTDKRNHKDVHSYHMKHVCGIEYSETDGNKDKHSLFTFGLNMGGDLYTHMFNLSGKALGLKAQASAYSFLVFGVSMLLYKMTTGLVTGKRMITYNKHTIWQVYSKAAGYDADLVKLHKKGWHSDMTVASAESMALQCSLWQRFRN